MREAASLPFTTEVIEGYQKIHDCQIELGFRDLKECVPRLRKNGEMNSILGDPVEICVLDGCLAGAHEGCESGAVCHDEVIVKIKKNPISFRNVKARGCYLEGGDVCVHIVTDPMEIAVGDLAPEENQILYPLKIVVFEGKAVSEYLHELLGSPSVGINLTTISLDRVHGNRYHLRLKIFSSSAETCSNFWQL